MDEDFTRDDFGACPGCWQRLTSAIIRSPGRCTSGTLMTTWSRLSAGVVSRHQQAATCCAWSLRRSRSRKTGSSALKLLTPEACARAAHGVL